MIALPSRGRPKLLERFLSAYLKTQSEVPVYVRLDSDDPALPDYLSIVTPAHWQVVVGPRAKFPAACNELFVSHPNEPFYGFVADDIVPETIHWDNALVRAAGEHGVAWGNDGYQAPRCTHPVIGGQLMRTVGYFAAPGFLHWYVDTVWEWLAQQTGRAVYLPEVITRHLHYELDTTRWDATYRERFSLLDCERGEAADRQRWQEWLTEEGPALVARIHSAYPSALRMEQ
jgi:hypothetical protein